MAQIDDDSRKETGFRSAQHKTCQVKLEWSVYECGQSSKRSPRNHRRGNHSACTPTLDQQGPGNLKGHIAEKEDSDPHAKNAVVESKVASHSDRGIGHASAVKVVRDVKNKEERKQTKSDVTPCVVHRERRNKRDRVRGRNGQIGRPPRRTQIDWRSIPEFRHLQN